MDVGSGGGGGVGASGPRGVLAGFVSTAVLTSSDGVRSAPVSARVSTLYSLY